MNKYVDSRTRSAVQNVFVELVAIPDAHPETLEKQYNRALDMLIGIRPDIQQSTCEGVDSEKWTEQEAKHQDANVKVQARYFSSLRGGKVEFFINNVTKKHEIRVYRSLDQPERLYSTLGAEDEFQTPVIAVTASVSSKTMNSLIFSDVLETPELAERSNKMLRDACSRYTALLDKLRCLYEKEAMRISAASGDSYSPWFALDEAVAKYDREKRAQEKEDEWRMRIG